MVLKCSDSSNALNTWPWSPSLGESKGGKSRLLGTFTGSRDPVPHTDTCYSPEGPFSFGVPFFQSLGCFHCLVCSFPTALSAWPILFPHPLRFSVGPPLLESLKCLDSSSHSPRLTATWRGTVPGSHGLFMPLSISCLAVSPWGKVHSLTAVFLSICMEGGTEEEHRNARTKIRFMLSDTRSVFKACPSSSPLHHELPTVQRLKSSVPT